MKNRFTFGSLLFAMASISGGASAAETHGAEGAGPPKPAPELVEYMKDILGIWTCATTFPAGAMGPGSPEIKATAKVKLSKEPALGGFFYRGEYAIAKSKAMPMAFAGIFYLGYDAGSKQITNVSVDNMGSISMGAGPMTGDTISWSGEGYMMGSKAKVRESMTKVSPKQVTHKFEVDMGKGFQPMGEDVCKR